MIFFKSILQALITFSIASTVIVPVYFIWKKDFPSWNFLSSLGKNKIIQRTFIYLFLLPFLINIFEFIDKKYALNLVSSIPFTWQIFYYSALLFSLGSLLYYFFCPRVIQDNSSFAEFSSSGKGWMHLESLQKEMNINNLYEFEKEYGDNVGSLQNVRLQKPSALEWIKTLNGTKKRQFSFWHDLFINREQPAIVSQLERQWLQEEPMSRVDQTNEYDRTDQKNLNYQYWKTYDYGNLHHTVVRALCSFLYLMGTLLIWYVVLESIITVFNYNLLN